MSVDPTNLSPQTIYGILYKNHPEDNPYNSYSANPYIPYNPPSIQTTTSTSGGLVNLLWSASNIIGAGMDRVWSGIQQTPRMWDEYMDYCYGEGNSSFMCALAIPGDWAIDFWTTLGGGVYSFFDGIGHLIHGTGELVWDLMTKTEETTKDKIPGMVYTITHPNETLGDFIMGLIRPYKTIIDEAIKCPPSPKVMVSIIDGEYNFRDCRPGKVAGLISTEMLTGAVIGKLAL